MEAFITRLQTTFKKTIAYNVWRALEDEGYPTYVVGGFLRNIALDAPVHDVDLATAATPSEIITVFGKDHASLVGAHFGTVLVLIDGTAVEVTTFRTESSYHNHRWPEVTYAKTIIEDLERRDFTVNAMAYRHGDGLIDPFLGYNDTRERVLRCVGEPSKRFEEDALRLMRGLRFMHRFHLTVDQETRGAMVAKRDLLKNISAERFVHELDLVFATGNTTSVLTFGHQIGIWSVILPDWQPPLVGLMVDSNVNQSDRIVLQWAYALSTRPLSVVKQDMKRLRFSKEREQRVFYLLKNATKEWNDVTQVDLKQMLERDGATKVLLLLAYHVAHHPSQDVLQAQQTVKDIIIRREPYAREHLAVNGHDLRRLGVDDQEMKNVFCHLVTLVQHTPKMNTKEALTQWVIDNQ